MATKKKSTAATKKGSPAKKHGPPEVNLYKLDGGKKGKVNLPHAFAEEFRPDLIRRAVVSSQANRRQPYGPGPKAGMRHSVEWPGKGRGMARTPRTNAGSGTGAEAPNTRGGRKAHPPKPEKDYSKKINRKEAKKARLSALGAVHDQELVKKRGHKFDDKLTLPIVLEDGVEDVSSAKDAIEILEKLGVYDDVVRARDGIHMRAGRGKLRGRRWRKPRGPLVVVSDGRKARGFRNLPGTDIVSPARLSTEMLAPGGDPGRLTIISSAALKEMEGW